MLSVLGDNKQQNNFCQPGYQHSQNNIRKNICCDIVFFNLLSKQRWRPTEGPAGGSEKTIILSYIAVVLCAVIGQLHAQKCDYHTIFRQLRYLLADNWISFSASR